MSRSPHALPTPEYRLAPRVGSVPKSRGVMQAVFPWRQGMPYGSQITSVKFSLAGRLRRQGGKRAWLWVAVTSVVTVCLVRMFRGGQVAHELLGEPFSGILVTDRYSAYH